MIFSASSVNSIAASRLRIATPRVFLLLMLLLKSLESSYYYDLETLRQDVADYIDFFNNMRPHQKLVMLTPTEAEEKHAEEK
jgi:transposase InsO family protein